MQPRKRKNTGILRLSWSLIIWLSKAQSNAEQYKKLKLEEARHQAALKHAEIIKSGNQRAAAMKEKGTKNLSKAVQLLVLRFKEQLHVKA